jgi:hypothetical protein
MNSRKYACSVAPIPCDGSIGVERQINGFEAELAGFHNGRLPNVSGFSGGLGSPAARQSWTVVTEQSPLERALVSLENERPSFREQLLHVYDLNSV